MSKACRDSGQTSTVLSASSRAFTQALSRVVYEYEQFSGVAYRSRFDPSAVCLALFDGAHDYRHPSYDVVDIASADFAAACEVHHLPVPRTVPSTPPAKARP